MGYSKCFLFTPSTRFGELVGEFWLRDVTFIFDFVDHSLTASSGDGKLGGSINPRMDKVSCDHFAKLLAHMDHNT